jgi:hypothetical protein
MAKRMEDVTTVELPVGSPATTAGWPVYWSSVFVGALTAVAVALMLGLLAGAIEGYDVVRGRPSAADLGVGDLIAVVCGAFFSFVAGGWVAARIAGLRRADTGALHGAIAWLVAVPMLLVLVALGAGTMFGTWYAGLAGTPAWVTPARAPADAAEMMQEAAGGALTALLLGLMGGVLGGWFGSGEAMNPSGYFQRRTSPSGRARREV